MTRAAPTEAPGRWRHGAALLVLTLLSLPFTLSSLVQPWGRDQGIYAHAATRLLDGYVPYTETYVFKPPGTVLIHALAMGLMGREMWAIRVLDAGWSLLTAAVVYGILWRATRDRAASVLGGLLLCWQVHRVNWWGSAQTDAWQGLFVAVGILLLLTGPARSLWRGALAGALLGLALWLKYTVGGFLGVLVLLPVLRGGWRAWPAVAGVVGGFVLGGASGVVALWAAGAWDAFLAIQREVVFPYTGAGGKGIARGDLDLLGTRMEKFYGLPVLVLSGLSVVVIAAEAAWHGFRDRHLPDRTVAAVAGLGWAAAGLLSVWAQGKFFQYHFGLLLGGFALLLALLLHRAGRRIGRRSALLLGVLLLLAGFEVDHRQRWRELAPWLAGRASLEEVWHRENYRTRDMSLRENVAVGRWLARHTERDDRILVWSYDPMVYVLAERDMVGRFPYTYPLVVRWAPVERYEEELMDDLRADPPAAIVIGSGDAVRLVTGHGFDSWKTFRRFEALRRWVDAEYPVEQRVGRFRVRLRGATGETGG
jgi:hypothetical protein